MKRFSLSVACLLMASVAWAAEPLTLPLPKDANEPRQPQVAVAGVGEVYVTFGAGKTVYSTASQDGARQFGDPVAVASLPSLMLGRRRGPRIATAKEAIVIAAIGQGGELLSWRSPDRGQTWQGPVTINDVPKSAREGLHSLAAGAFGQLYCVWLDLRNNQPEVFGAGSTDGGKTWSQNRLVYRSPDGNVCECCHPSVTFDSQGNLSVMWRNWLDGNRDLYWSASKDGGRTFSKAEPLGQGHWRLDHCPMDGGAIAAVKPGEVATVWRRQKEVFATFPGHRQEVRLGTGEQPWIAADQSGVWLTWITREGGDLLLQRPNGQPAEVVAHQARDPVIAAPLTGKGPVVLAWEEGQGPKSRLRILAIPASRKP
jgi:hypothetical protein